MEEPAEGRIQSAMYLLPLSIPLLLFKSRAWVGWVTVGSGSCSPSAHKPYFSQCYRDLALVSRDGMNIVLNKINQLLMEKYLKLQDTCRTQVRPGKTEDSWSVTEC